jgi:transcriptional regulator with XRE-family HTH domain
VTAAQIIREARLKAGLTQSQLADRLGRERAQVARWEIGGQEPGFENVVAVVEACGFALNVEIVERVHDHVLDAELTDSLLEAPQQRVQTVLERLSGRSSKHPPFDPYTILEALEGERIAYVLVGAFARAVHGSAEPTRGIDISPSVRDDDLRRLAGVIDRLGGRGPDREPIAAEQLAAGERSAIATPLGELGIIPTPWGTRGYDGLGIRATRENLGHGIRPPIASLADCVRMLDASDRPIDQQRIQRVRRMMELERSLVRSRQRGLSIER